MTATISPRELNRWTLARQHLIERAPLDAEAGIASLAGMQAQHPPSPYIGLWSRLTDFRREDLTQALAEDRVVKATLMRGTLHLVPTAGLPHYRVAAGSAYFATTRRMLHELGADLDAIREAVRTQVQLRPHNRAEVGSLIAGLLPGVVPSWVHERPTAIGALSVATDLVNLADDAAFGYSGGSRYRLAPPAGPVDTGAALRHVVTAYLAAYGPASRADLAQWSGNTVATFASTLDELDLVVFRADEGPLLLDLPDAPRPAADAAVPVRFLPKWDSLLLAHARRERVLPEPLRRLVIAKNGDVAPTFLVDGRVAGIWTAPLRGRAVLTLRALQPLPAAARRPVEEEGARLLAWLRDDTTSHDLRWA